MKIPVLQAVFCGVLSLWATTAGAQDVPRIAVKLTPEAHKKQQADPNFIANLIQRARRGPPSAAFSINSNQTVSVSPLIQSRDSLRFARRAARSLPADRRADDAPNFDLWYQVEVDTAGVARRSPATNGTEDSTAEPRLPAETLELIHALHELEDVQSAHALYPGPPPAVNPNDDPRRPNQGYLNAAPQGINAPFGWSYLGGDGAGVQVIDVEQGWNFNHQDLAAARITLISGQNRAYFDHGTSVMGQILMVDNKIGGIGIIPAARGRVVSQHRSNGRYNTPEAILDAAANLNYGDIMLLEAQEYDPKSGSYYWPVEIADANFDAIKAATNKGIIVVQAGCNGGYNLDAYTNLAGKKIFDRSSRDFRDSGSIMVGGALSTVPHSRWASSNYGSRIDVYSWAQNIDTTTTNAAGTDNTLYTTGFGGTSGASPVIVGAAGIVQGISMNRRNGLRYGPLEMRSLLSNTATGTASANPASDRIGVQPDLSKIIPRIPVVIR